MIPFWSPTVAIHPAGTAGNKASRTRVVGTAIASTPVALFSLGTGSAAAMRGSPESGPADWCALKDQRGHDERLRHTSSNETQQGDECRELGGKQVAHFRVSQLLQGRPRGPQLIILAHLLAAFLDFLRFFLVHASEFIARIA